MRLGLRDLSRRTAAGVILAVAALTLSALTVRAPDAHAGPPAAAEDDWVETTLAAMTLEEKVGQLFMTNVYGSTADTQVPADVAANQALYGVDNAAQLDREVPPRRDHLLRLDQQRAEPQPDRRALQRPPGRRPRPARRQVPPLIGIDQESGVVARIGPPATQFPGQHGARRRPQRRRTRSTPPRSPATSSRAMGINRNFAPVADVNVNPANPVIGVRSFGENPRLVADLTAAQVRGYHRRRWPRRPSTSPATATPPTDSHTGLPVIDHTREEWEQLDAAAVPGRHRRAASTRS